MHSMKLTPAQLALLPDDNDVAFFEENGYYLSKADGDFPHSPDDA
jgi:hypothetical protein